MYENNLYFLCIARGFFSLYLRTKELSLQKNFEL